jgi:hypothetical protein
VLSSKCEALSSNPCTTKKGRKEEREGGRKEGIFFYAFGGYVSIFLFFLRNFSF